MQQDKLINTILSNNYSYFILIMALTAIPVGFVAGLFGIGGGLITVPFLFYIFGSLDFDQSYNNVFRTIGALFP